MVRSVIRNILSGWPRLGKTMVGWIIVSACATTRAESPDTLDRAYLTNRVIGQVVADLGSAGAPPELLKRFDVSGDALELAKIVSDCQGVELFRVRALFAIDGSPFIVAKVHSRTFLLGGFSAPEVLAYLSAIEAEFLASCSDSFELTRVLDPFGAVEVVSAERNAPEANDAIHRWRLSREQTGWLPDTTFQLSGGGSLERVTVMTKSAGAYPQWTPVAYVFVRDSAGRLLGWSRRVGAAVGP